MAFNRLYQESAEQFRMRVQQEAAQQNDAILLHNQNRVAQEALEKEQNCLLRVSAELNEQLKAHLLTQNLDPFVPLDPHNPVQNNSGILIKRLCAVPAYKGNLIIDIPDDYSLQNITHLLSFISLLPVDNHHSFDGPIRQNLIKKCWIREFNRIFKRLPDLALLLSTFETHLKEMPKDKKFSATVIFCLSNLSHASTVHLINTLSRMPKEFRHITVNFDRLSEVSNLIIQTTKSFSDFTLHYSQQDRDKLERGDQPFNDKINHKLLSLGDYGASQQEEKKLNFLISEGLKKPAAFLKSLRTTIFYNRDFIIDIPTHYTATQIGRLLDLIALVPLDNNPDRLNVVYWKFETALTNSKLNDSHLTEFRQEAARLSKYGKTNSKIIFNISYSLPRKTTHIFLTALSKMPKEFRHLTVNPHKIEEVTKFSGLTLHCSKKDREASSWWFRRNIAPAPLDYNYDYDMGCFAGGLLKTFKVKNIDMIRTLNLFYTHNEQGFINYAQKDDRAIYQTPLGKLLQNNNLPNKYDSMNASLFNWLKQIEGRIRQYQLKNGFPPTLPLPAEKEQEPPTDANKFYRPRANSMTIEEFRASLSDDQRRVLYEDMLGNFRNH
jgi:hypothetical protein